MVERKPIIAVVGGTGALGGALAGRWARAGYRVIAGSRDANKAREAASQLSTVTNAQIEGASNAEAAGGKIRSRHSEYRPNSRKR